MSKLAGVYCSEEEMRHVIETAPKSVAWFYDGELRSVRAGNFLYRRYFDTHERICELIECLRSAGVKGTPGSYAWIWRKLGPRVKRGKLSGKASAGTWPYAWCESFPGESMSGKVALQSMEIPGPVYFYDMNSAYGWATTCENFPLPSSAVVHFKPPKKLRSRYAMVCVDGTADPVRNAPPCVRHLGYSDSESVRRLRRIWLTAADALRYGIRWSSILRVVDYRAELDLTPYIDRLREILPTFAFKAVMQKAWGTWCPAGKLAQVSFRNGKKNSAHTMRGFRWPELMAHVVSRVNAKLFGVVEKQGALRIYVDSVTTLKLLPTSTAWGDWRLESTQPFITLYPGNPGRIDGPRGPLKHAGERESEAVWRYVNMV